ncbi:MAG: lipoyl(octanoyl) transferase LipB [Gammaproteobacteria bacterium]|nr:lipoyl(octanoyl) transferase LipB [Gammaproteobacteria bacterium]MBT4494168.1 lipoyl(octanoyl) transferase LipB [Gammaproteobacteria bacterium]MBT7372109.1 lipoyl(octanoyl) transferase LipB [Gammaproteobacteria bacterium]
MTKNSKLVVKNLGLVPYEQTWQRMKDFTDTRDEETLDELWLLQHPSVYTLGQAGKQEHVLTPGDIPIVKSDRGGQVTYHGPGQLVVYLLVDIKRIGIGVRFLVTGIERAVIDFLGRHGVAAMARKDAPGVYVEGRKVAALGLRVRRGRSYHGLSLNVDMDLAPFKGINPCGYEGLEVIDLKGLGVNLSVEETARELTPLIGVEFGYDALLK